MKKLYLVVALIMVLALSACGSFTPKDPDDNNGSDTVATLLGLEAIIVPFYDHQGNVVRSTVGEGSTQTTYLSSSELQAVINGLDIVLNSGQSISDFDGSFEISRLVRETGHTPVLNSAILHATLSNELLSLADEQGIVVPYYDEDGTPIRVRVGEGEIHPVTGESMATDYIAKAEIQALINALDIMLGEGGELGDFSTTFDVSLLVAEEGFSPVMNSAIIRATMSKEIIDLDTLETLVLPYFDALENPIRVLVGEGELDTVTEESKETVYIVKTELQALINALNDILGEGGDFNGFDGTITLGDFVMESGVTEILNSAIIHATISRELFDLDGNGTIVIPWVDQSLQPLRIIVGTLDEETEFIVKEEIQALINGLDVLLGVGESFDNFGGAFNLASIFNPINTIDHRDTLLASTIIHATISKILLDLDDVDGILVVPVMSADETSVVRLVVGDVGEESYYVNDQEIKQLIEALVAMGYSDFDTFGTGIASDKFFDERAILLASHVIHATLSYQMLNETGGNLVVPDFVRVETTASDLYVTLIEIEALLDALEDMGLTNFNTITISPQNLLDGTVDFETHITTSKTMHATISKFILDIAVDESVYTDPGVNNTLVVPTTLREYITVDTALVEQIAALELVALLEAIELLGMTEFGASFPAGIITGMSDADLDRLLASGSVHVTIDVMLNDNANILVPGRAKDTIYALDDVTLTVEIKRFIQAVITFDDTADFTNAAFDLSAITALNQTERNTILESMIVQYTLTPSVQDAIALYQGSVDPLYEPLNTYFYDDNPATFFTGEGIELVLIDVGLVTP